MTESEHRKALLLSRIEAQRSQVGNRVKRLKQSASPAAAAGSVGRMFGSRLGFLPTVAGFVARKGPRGSTWIRVAAAAALLLPVASNWLSGRKKRRRSAADATAAVE